VVKGWTSVSLKDDLVALIDRFLADNQWAYSNRAEVLATAAREFLQRHGMEPQTAAPQDSSKGASENQGMSESKQKRVHSPR